MSSKVEKIFVHVYCATSSGLDSRASASFNGSSTFFQNNFNIIGIIFSKDLKTCKYEVCDVIFECHTSFCDLFTTFRDFVTVYCLFLWILLRRQESCRCGCFCCFFIGSRVLFLYKYLLLVLSTCRSLGCSLNSKHSRANVMLVKIVPWSCLFRLHSKCALRQMVSLNTGFMIWLQNVNGRTKMSYQVWGTFKARSEFL